MKKIINQKRVSVVVLFLMFFALSNQLLAQKTVPAEFNVHAAGAFSTYLQPAFEGSSVGYNGDFGLGFTGFFSRNVGINIGLGLGFFNIKSTVTGLETNIKHGLDDKVNNLKYDLYTTLSNYTEVHKPLFLNIPIMLVFQTQKDQQWSWKQSQRPSFYLICGAKALLLFNNKYEVSVDTITNKAYYPALNNWATTQEFAGLGSFNNEGAGYKSSGKMEFGIIVAAAIELGVKWRTEGSVAIYTGAFFDFGFPIKDNRTPYEEYISEEKLKNATLMKFADTYLMTAGIRVRIAFSKRQTSRY